MQALYLYGYSVLQWDASERVGRDNEDSGNDERRSGFVSFFESLLLGDFGAANANADAAPAFSVHKADAQRLAAHFAAVAKVAAPKNASPQTRRNAALAALDLAASDEHENNKDALMLLGDMHLNSRFFHGIDSRKAFKYYDKLANVHANATAQRILGMMYATGLGVKRDYPKALLYMSFAALADDLIAHQTLGYWHSVGIATPKSCPEAVWHYKAVADKIIEQYKSGPPGGLTLPPTKIRLPEATGGIFGPGASGPGAPSKNPPQSAHAQKSVRDIFEISAQEGDHSVQLELASIYYTGTRHTPPNYTKAVKYFLSASKAYLGKKPTGDVSPQLRHRMSVASLAAGYLGTMYWRGEGVKRDDAIARQWFERGEELDNGMSLNGLGMMVLRGEGGFEVDTSKALQYFTNAIQKDYADAYVNLAELTLKTGNPDALSTALKFYNTASQKPPASPLTLYRLAEFHHHGLGGTPKNCATALGFYKSLVEKADFHTHGALHRAGRHFERGTKADWEAAFVGYLFAAESGYEVAQTNAAWMIDEGYVGGVSTEEEEVEREKGVVAGGLRVYANDLYEVAIVLWNRAANQGNVDARVKMGDYNYYGLGVKVYESVVEEGVVKEAEGGAAEEDGVSRDSKAGGGAVEVGMSRTLYTAWRRLVAPYLAKQDAVLSEPRYEKAALYYQVAADEASALAQFNIGWMHENGIGVAKDFPLAKRMYDTSLSTNPESYLAATLALTHLHLKMHLHTLTHVLTDLVTPSTYRTLLKKWQWVEDVEEFVSTGVGHVKGAVPASVDEHLVSVGGKGGEAVEGWRVMVVPVVGVPVAGGAGVGGVDAPVVGGAVVDAPVVGVVEPHAVVDAPMAGVEEKALSGGEASREKDAPLVPEKEPSRSRGGSPVRGEGK
ncbi:ERAD-associated protein [Podochytrium sp. JEL0797]|nr:ERAD-associated protein [Podochytrium sp. JEL0797]